MTEFLSPTAVDAGGRPPSQDISTFDTTEARKQWQVVIRRFLRHRLAVAGMVLFVFLLLVAFVGGQFWKHSYKVLGFPRYQPPSGDHPFGTDGLGADMVAQTIRGLRFSLQIAIIVALVSYFMSQQAYANVGALAGYKRGWADALISRVIDLLLVIPGLVIVVVMARSSFTNVPGKSGSNWLVVAMYLSLVFWLGVARVVRGMVLSLREKEFVEAARAMGGSTLRIVFKQFVLVIDYKAKQFFLDPLPKPQGTGMSPMSSSCPRRPPT